jgi:hypothetical protein
MIEYGEAAAAVAAVLDDPERSLIGDPREGVYKVSLISTANMKEAMQFAKQLARVGITPTTTLYHDDFGFPLQAYVNVHPHSDQRHLFELVEKALSQPRRQALEDLVLARGPIPEELLERIWRASDRGLTPHQIAAKMNELDIMPGRRGKGWTAKKVKAALSAYEERPVQERKAA